jgi:DNA adenine methylase
MTNIGDAKPFLKWAGSKRKLLHHLLPVVPPDFGTYYEPFLGSGALFFALEPDKAVLADAIPNLIDTYKAVRDDVERVIHYLSRLLPTKEQYYQTRAAKPSDRFASAAQFIFLNKTCWNGLYRVNSRGEFNVPFGWMKSPFVYSSDDLRKCSEILSKKNIKLRCCDFEKVLSSVQEGDLVYLDPPYVTSHYKNGFHEWNARLFTWNDQKRLAEAAREISERGAHVIVTNADHPDIIKLYKGFAIRRFYRHSTLAAVSAFRRPTSEVLMTRRGR